MNATTARTGPSKAKRLAVIIVNYRTPRLVLDCLRSLKSELDERNDTVIVVDNASGDGSPDRIDDTIREEHWSAWAHVVRSDTNDGFSAGNNLGIRTVAAQAYLLLNSDTLVRPGAINSLLSALQNHPDVGIFAPRLEWPDATPQISTFRFHSPVSELIQSAGTGVVTRILTAFDVPQPISDSTGPFEWASFACILIRAEVFDRVGLMDEGYFMYFEDVDFCRRARQAGWTTLHWPSARVVHLRGGTSDVKRLTLERKRRPAYYYASRTRYFAKFYGTAGLWTANMLWLTGRAISLLREVVGKSPAETCAYEYRDIWTNAWAPLHTAARRGEPAS